MAYSIGAMDGVKEGVSVDYPFNQIKNAPSGTRVNKKMLGDAIQLLQKIMNIAGITPNDQPDNVTNKYQLLAALSYFVNYTAAPIFQNLIGIGYDATKVYVLSGCEAYTDDGVAFYNGKIYYVSGDTSGLACGPGLISVFAVQAGDYVGSLPLMRIGCGASGSGAGNFVDAIYFNQWQDAGALTFGVSPGGGSITVAPGDIVYNRYLLRGNTVTYQLKIRGATTTSALSFITILTTFLPGKAVVNDLSMHTAGVYNNEPAIITIAGGGGGTSFKFKPLSGFIYTAGSEDFDLNITYEIEP